MEITNARKVAEEDCSCTEELHSSWKERKKKGGKEEEQKVREDGFLEAEREPRVSCVAGCGTKWPRTIKRTEPAKASFDFRHKGR